VLLSAQNGLMLTVELDVRAIPAVHSRFSRLIGEQHWGKRTDLLKSEIRGNPFLEHLLVQENAIAFQLERLSQLLAAHGPAPPTAYDDETIYEGASFAAQVLSVLNASDDKTGARLMRRVHGALKNPDDMRGFRLELKAATHFIRAGRKVAWPELNGSGTDGSQGTYDLLIEDVGLGGLELECKSFSEQVGRRVTRRHALDFYGLVKRHHWEQLLQLRHGMLGVLTVPDRIPTGQVRRRALADDLARRVLFCSDGLYDIEGGHIRIGHFDPLRLTEIAAGAPKRRGRQILDEISGTRNREVMVVGTQAGGACMMVVQSARDDGVLDSMFATLSDSAGRQFSKTRAAMFFAALEGLDADQVLDLGRGDQLPGASPSSLWRRVSAFLEPATRDHLVGVCFASASSIRPTAIPGVVDSGGSAYNFPRRTSRFWSEDFLGMFGAEPGGSRLQP
jgi:hypothetical protein